jgi:hypothetical protein
VTLWEPFGQKYRERIAVRTLEDEVLIVAIIKKHEFFLNDWMKLANGFDAATFLVG